MGAPKEDYSTVAPPGSFIHVDDFASPHDLADFLNQIADNSTLYSSYFLWRTQGSFIDTKFYCRVCALLHAAADTGHVTWYDDVEQWWRGGGICVESSADNYFASWRHPYRKHWLESKWDEEVFTIKWINGSFPRD